MARTRWGLVGPGAIAQNFADGLAGGQHGELVAVSGRDPDRRRAFAERNGVPESGQFADHEALLAADGIDAVYVATPHPFHVQIGLNVIRSGRALLVEKPAGLCATEVTALAEAAAQENILFLEGYMYRCHPQVARVLDIIGSGEIGDVQHLRATFGFQAGFDPASRLFDPKMGGGAILDVGGYPMSLARLVAGAATGQSYAEPVALRGTGVIGKSGVDEVALATMSFSGGMTAEIGVAITRAMDNDAVITGSKGRIIMADPWTPGRNAGPSDTTLTVETGGETRVEDLRHPEHLFTFEADLASKAVADGLTEAPHPAMSPAESIANNAALDRWRAELGYVTHNSTIKGNKRLAGALPGGLPQIPSIVVEGVKARVSQLIMGCDNRDTLADGAVVWDAFIEAGGNTFDTGFVYGGGLHEQVLGQWIRARGVADEITVIAKGAHSPYCTPRAIAAQLDISLDRLGLERAPIYIMHRDNPDVPVGEFVDALNALHKAGRIGIFGGSNWTPARIRDANDYAARNDLQPMRILNNNLSLAVMERPIWPGCVTSNTPETLEFLRETGMAHMSWSSQARGYFLPTELRDRLPADIGPDACFGSKDNEERRRRAEALAAERGVTPFNVATAWVLAQDFPSFALIGPRSPGEIATTLPALSLNLTRAEALWLNLETDSR